MAGGTVPDGFIPISAATGAGFDLLEEAVYKKASGNAMLSTEEAVIDSQRQKKLIERSLSAIERVRKGMADAMPLDVVAVDLEEAVRALGELTGEITSEDILENMFSRLCFFVFGYKSTNI